MQWLNTVATSSNSHSTIEHHQRTENQILNKMASTRLTRAFLREMTEAMEKCERADDQARPLEIKLVELQVRLDRACRDNKQPYITSLRMQIDITEAFRKLYEEISQRAIEKVAELQDSLIVDHDE